MNQTELATLTNEALLTEAKKAKSAYITNAVLFGLMIGIAIYSTVTKGFGFSTIFPLFFALLFFNNSKKNAAMKAELERRNLK